MCRNLLIFLAVIALFVSGCGPSSSDGNAKRTDKVASTNLQIFQVNGVVIEVKPQEASVKIKHEEVPNYMPAMTMPFDVKNTNELKGIEAGDPVSFRLLVTDTEGWIDQIKKTGPKTNLPPAIEPIREVKLLVEGAMLPEYHFVNQSGKPFSTTNFLGGAVAIEFLFTRCPLPDFCPFLARNFRAAQQQLKALPSAPTNWHLLTISFDPEFDTPAVLHHYGQAHEADFSHWIFATGSQIDVTAIGEQLGLMVSRDENNSLNHNLRAAVIDTSGRVRKVFIGNEWKADELVAEILKATTAQ